MSSIVKREKFFYTIFVTFTASQFASQIYFLGFWNDQHSKLYNFSPLPTIVETAMDALPPLIIYLFN